MPSVQEVIDEIVQKEYLEAHGSSAVSSLKTALKNKKTGDILQSFKSFYFQDPIDWSVVKDTVWGSDEERKANEYSFLQGDIIETTLVESLSQSRSHQSHDLWIVCTPSCDIPRGPQYIKVMRLYQVDVIDKEESSKNHGEFKKLMLACKFHTPKFFALPAFPKDTPDVLGYYVDTETPYYLDRAHMVMAAVKYSLKFNAWHLFNMALMEKNTRSNPEDEPNIRCSFEKIPLPCLKRKEVRVYHGEKDYRVVANHQSGEHHEYLRDDETYTGLWVDLSEGKKAYWFVKQGAHHSTVMKTLKK